MLAGGLLLAVREVPLPSGLHTQSALGRHGRAADARAGPEVVTRPATDHTSVGSGVGGGVGAGAGLLPLPHAPTLAAGMTSTVDRMRMPSRSAERHSSSILVHGNHAEISSPAGATAMNRLELASADPGDVARVSRFGFRGKPWKSASRD